MSMFTNKVLLEFSHARLFTDCQRLLLLQNLTFEIKQMGHKICNIYSLVR